MCTQRSLAVANLVLRQQLAVLKERSPRVQLTDADRVFWVVLSRSWSPAPTIITRPAMLYPPGQLTAFRITGESALR